MLKIKRKQLIMLNERSRVGIHEASIYSMVARVWISPGVPNDIAMNVSMEEWFHTQSRKGHLLRRAILSGAERIGRARCVRRGAFRYRGLSFDHRCIFTADKCLITRNRPARYSGSIDRFRSSRATEYPKLFERLWVLPAESISNICWVTLRPFRLSARYTW